MTNTLDYTHYGKIKVSGKDRAQFLQNVLTQDILALQPGDHTEAAFLTAQGRVLGYFIVFTHDDFYLLTIEKGHETKVIEQLEKFIITEDVILEDVSLTFLDERLKLGEHDLTKPNEESWRIQEGIPRFGIDFDESTILSETGLEKKSVSETKGCYPGQEVIAKIETYDGLNRKLLKLEFESEVVPQKGTKILLGNAEIGFVTSACPADETDKVICLGYVKRSAWERVNELRLEVLGKR